jgi:hypothetical protein
VSAALRWLGWCCPFFGRPAGPLLGVVGRPGGVKAGREATPEGLGLEAVGSGGQALVGAGGVGGVGHDASEWGGSVRRLSDVRVSRSHVGDAQVVAPD